MLPVSKQPLGKHVPAETNTRATIEERYFRCGPRRGFILKGIMLKAKHIHKRKPHLLVREDVTYGLVPQEFSWKKSLVVSLKGSDAKTNRLAVNRQSYSNFDFDFDQVSCQFKVSLWRED
jgi:hypothetical protein